jgi:hypothetical protein
VSYIVKDEFYIPPEIRGMPIDKQTMAAFGIAGYADDEKRLYTEVRLQGKERRTGWDVAAWHGDGAKKRGLGSIACAEDVARAQVLSTARSWLEAAGCMVFEPIEKPPETYDGLVIVNGITLVQLRSAVELAAGETAQRRF